MDPKVWIEIGKAVLTLKEHLETLEKHSTAADRASRGREPYPSKPSVEAALQKIEEVTNQFTEVARTGIGHHQPVAIAMQELASPATRSRAIVKFRTELSRREAFLAEAQKVLGEAERLASEAPRRANALREMQKFFERMVTTSAPVDIGTVGRATAFEYSRLFERASGRMGSLGNAATRAAARIRPDLMKLQQETANLRANLRTFGLL